MDRAHRCRCTLRDRRRGPGAGRNGPRTRTPGTRHHHPLLAADAHRPVCGRRYVPGGPAASVPVRIPDTEFAPASGAHAPDDGHRLFGQGRPAKGRRDPGGFSVFAGVETLPPPRPGRRRPLTEELGHRARMSDPGLHVPRGPRALLPLWSRPKQAIGQWRKITPSIPPKRVDAPPDEVLTCTHDPGRMVAATRSLYEVREDTAIDALEKDQVRRQSCGDRLSPSGITASCRWGTSLRASGRRRGLGEEQAC